MFERAHSRPGADDPAGCGHVGMWQCGEMTGFKILKSWLGGYATKRLVGTKLRSYCSGESCSGELESVSGNPSLRTLTCASDAVHVDVPGAA